ncbi:MAG: DUF4292 domain-containing protein [Candidatus Kapabacteria bacterium]|nr:DUF4292 domain-containing protein [Candidatus Kapabacteria bacterium]
MRMQSTSKHLGVTSYLITGLAVIIGAWCVPGLMFADENISLDSILSRRSALQASGTMSVQGPMTISGVPFDAILNADTMVVTTGSPFGMKTGSVFACRDTFVMLNFLTRQAYDGHPSSQQVTSLLPIPLGIDDIRCLVRGVPPGDLTSFEVVSRRDDGQVLYRRRDTATVEFALVDPALRSLRQYQRKRSDGTTMLNVTYGSFKDVDGVMIPFGVSVAANDEAQKMQFRFEEVRLAMPTEPMRPLAVPSSFTRSTFR